MQQNKLVLFACNGGIEEIDVTAEGGVVAGNLAMKALQLHGKPCVFLYFATLYISKVSALFA